MATNTNTDFLSSTIRELQRQQVLQPPQQPKPAKLGQADISSVWRKLMGAENWAGLLDPMHPLMRAELIRYGDMTQACYDSFDYDPWSKYCGSCKYLPEEFFEAQDLAHLGYSVTRFLYATANVDRPKWYFGWWIPNRWPDHLWSDKANWAGYVAVSDDETSKKLGRRDITVAWRGTVTHKEWVTDFLYHLRRISPEIPCSDDELMVETGFLHLYTDSEPKCRFCKYSARQQLLTEVKRLLEKYQEEEVSITITGHSLGGCLATLSAFDIAHTGLNVKKDGSRVHVSALTFAAPRVGNLIFKERLESLGVKVLRVHNTRDVVPKYPFGYLFITEASPPWLIRWGPAKRWVYSHVGVDLALDHTKSPDLNPKSDISCVHNLEAHLHLIDGYHGSNLGFESATGRDVALVNKSCDFVKEKRLVPPMWWQDLNKGLVKGPDGHWKQKERHFVDHPADMGNYIKQLGI